MEEARLGKRRTNKQGGNAPKKKGTQTKGVRMMKYHALLPLAVVLGLVAFGCKSAQPPSSTGEKDPTIELVMQDIDAYKGKQVRWFGVRVGEDHKGGILRYVFLNSSPNVFFSGEPGKDSKAFIVEYRPYKKLMTTDEMEAYLHDMKMMLGVWVTGTIKDIDGIDTSTYSRLTLQDKEGKEITIVPHDGAVLVEPKFEFPAGK